MQLVLLHTCVKYADRSSGARPRRPRIFSDFDGSTFAQRDYFSSYMVALVGALFVLMLLSPSSMMLELIEPASLATKSIKAVPQAYKYWRNKSTLARAWSNSCSWGT